MTDASPLGKVAARKRHLPWRDRAGRFSWLKALVFAALFAPAAAALYLLLSGGYAAEPAKGVNHELGLWAFRLILLSLAVTPAIQIFRWTRLILVRRMIGVAAFAYAFSHLAAYTAMENFAFGKVVGEILSRFYLTIGFVALLILAALAATSFDAMVRRMGIRAWTWLHRAVYLAGTLALIHYFIQSKLVVTEPTVFAGLFIWLMAYRVVAWVARPRVAAMPSTLLALALGAAALTMGGEAAGYALFTPVDAMKVFEANFTLLAGIRPGWVVLIFGVSVAVLALVKGWVFPAQRRAAAAA